MATDDAWGISSTGFYRPQADEVRDVLDASWRTTFGADRDTATDTVDGHFIDFAAEHVGKLWEAAEASYQATFVVTAAGTQLKELGAPIIGAAKAAAPTTVSWIAFGTDTTVVPIGTQVTHTGTNEPFTNDASVTIGAGDVTFVIGITVPASDPTLYRVTINGTNADFTTAGGETVTDIANGLAAAVALSGEPVNPDVAAPYLSLDENTGAAMTVTVFDDDTGTRMVLYDAVRAAATATNTGPTAVSLGISWDIANPITGLDAIINPDAGVTGQNDETDPEYRTRIRTSTQFGGMAADLLELDGVTFARVYENDQETIDAEGRPPHSVEAVVLGGAAADIAQAIWDSRRQGIQTFGSASSTATDGNGDPHTMNFNRPTDIPIYVDAVITQGEDWPTTGNPINDVKLAIEAYLDALTVGADVTPGGIMTAARSAVSQVADLTLKIDTIPTPVATGVLSISIRQIASAGIVTVA